MPRPGAQTKHRGGMQRSRDQIGCGKHGGGVQRNPNQTRHNGNNGGGQKCPDQIGHDRRGGWTQINLDQPKCGGGGCKGPPILKF